MPVATVIDNYFTKFDFERLLKKRNIDGVIRYFRLLTLLSFLILVGWLGFQGVNRYLVLESDIQNIINQTQSKKINAEAPLLTEQKSLDTAPISQNKIFGDIAVVNAPAGEEVKPKSDVPLSLVGTFLDSGQPFAIIQDDKKKIQDIFTVNDEIFEVAKVVKIHADNVEINRDGKIELLVLDQGGDTGAVSGSGDGGSASAESTNVNVDAQELDDALANLPLLLTQARAVPYFKDGKSLGLRLFAIKTGSLFEKIGLKNGDILKDINGSSMSDITQAVKLFERLKEEKNISLTLERGKRDIVLNYNIR